MWTTHGHQILGTIALDPIAGGRPDPVARCGGPTNCKQCASESSKAQKAEGKDEFGMDIPKKEG